MENAIYNLSLNVKHPTVLNIERQSRYNFSLPHYKPLITNEIGFRHELQSYIGPCHQLKLGEGLFVCCSLALCSYARELCFIEGPLIGFQYALSLTL